jgi:hypothetical protein
MRKKAATIIMASVLVLLHFIAVVVPVVSSGANGEAQAWAAMIFDMPLVWLLSAIPGGGRVLYNDTMSYTFVFCVIGTLMYGVVGALIGWIIDVIRARKSTA